MLDNLTFSINSIASQRHKSGKQLLLAVPQEDKEDKEWAAQSAAGAKPICFDRLDQNISFLHTKTIV